MNTVLQLDLRWDEVVLGVIAIAFIITIPAASIARYYDPPLSPLLLPENTNINTESWYYICVARWGLVGNLCEARHDSKYRVRPEAYAARDS